MKLSIFFVALIAANVSAAPKVPTPEAKGLYVGNSSQYNYYPAFAKPPQTTYALVEPNGEIWSVSATLWGVSTPIIGKIQTKKGDGSGFDYRQPPYPLELKTAITPTSIKLTIIEQTPSTSYHIPSPPPRIGQRGPYDPDLLLQPEGDFSAPAQMTDIMNSFTMNIVGNKFTGAQGNCNFEGTLGKAKGYREVVLTFKNDCYLNSGDSIRKKNIRMEGVIFTTKHYFSAPFNRPDPARPFENLDADTMPVNVLILKSKEGTSFGIAKFFKIN
jgi:hypothetical protein